MEEVKQTIKIDLERYDELIKKEVLFDKLMEGKDLSIYPYEKVKEVEKCEN